ncbi:hypothetical protein V5799_026895 [Amblyomma americanum]|uniref:Ammonium transporter AmtB-like domain-containing protein n=1 Tax=Amblyomma americanum TaxID=6943 RepID=A0AAQ4DHA2_AMBAM
MDGGRLEVQEGCSKNFTADDATWTLTASIVVFTMQTAATVLHAATVYAGFGLLESGCVSRKNEVNILMKNVADVVAGGLGFWFFGYGLQFGSGAGSTPLYGLGSFLVDADPQDMGRVFTCFLFQLSFATTATTIVSGAMAERTSFTAYCLFSFLNTLVYCIPAGWVWAPRGFLRQLGTLDFAGAGCVHLLGGVSALVAAAYLGPRTGRYGDAPPPELGNPTNVLQGTFTLWWGWVVFNAGSTVGVTNNKWKYASSLTSEYNVVEAGGSAFLGALDSLIVGSLGALLSSGVPPLLRRLRVDDPVDAVSVHGCGGAWGLLAVGLFAHSDEQGCTRCGLFRGGGGYLLGIQALTCVSIALWSAVGTYILLVIVNRLLPIRMSLEHEVLGSDLVEHGIVHPDIDYAQLLRRSGLACDELLPRSDDTGMDRESWDLRVCRRYLAEKLAAGANHRAPNAFMRAFKQWR